MSAYADKIAMEVLEADVRAGSRGLEHPPLEWHKAVALARAVSSAPITRPEALSAWQPMETAPKDGSEVLLRVKLRAGIPGKMLVGHFMRGGHCIEDHPPIAGGWYFFNGCAFDLASEPIEWMPLPLTPSPLRAAKDV